MITASSTVGVLSQIVVLGQAFGVSLVGDFTVLDNFRMISLPSNSGVEALASQA
jgi:hypothetical protein